MKVEQRHAPATLRPTDLSYIYTIQCLLFVLSDISPATPVITTKLTFFEDAKLLVSNLHQTRFLQQYVYYELYVSVMGARRYGQEGHLPPPLWKGCKVFCALVVTGKRSVDGLFMCIIFTTCRLLLELCPQTLTRVPSLDLAGGLSFPDTEFAHLLKKILRAPMVSVRLTASTAQRGPNKQLTTGHVRPCMGLLWSGAHVFLTIAQLLLTWPRSVAQCG